jgi:hypothetical protein
VVSVSAVMVLAVIVVLLVRKAGLKVLHASLCVLLGFYLASSSMAPSIGDFGDTMADMIDELSQTAS